MPRGERHGLLVGQLAGFEDHLEQAAGGARSARTRRRPAGGGFLDVAGDAAPRYGSTHVDLVGAVGERTDGLVDRVAAMSAPSAGLTTVAIRTVLSTQQARPPCGTNRATRIRRRRRGFDRLRAQLVDVGGRAVVGQVGEVEQAERETGLGSSRIAWVQFGGVDGLQLPHEPRLTDATHGGVHSGYVHGKMFSTNDCFGNSNAET